MGAKGGDKDWYGYCVDDPVNRVDAWGLFWGEETSGGRIVRNGLETAGSWEVIHGVHPFEVLRRGCLSSLDTWETRH